MSRAASRAKRSRTGRETLGFARPSPSGLLGRSPFGVSYESDALRSLSLVQDLRRWSPEVLRDTPRRLSGYPARVVVSPAPKARATRGRANLFSTLSARVAFDVPRSVLICVRRRRRREVIHALGVAGGKVRRPRRNAFSDVSCKGVS